MIESVLCELQSFGFKVKKEKNAVASKDCSLLGHAVTKGSYSMQPMLENLKVQVSRIQRRHTLQHTLGLVNGLKPHDMQFAVLVEEFY